MLFNSFDFGIFLIISLIIYWRILNNNLKLQNYFLLFASYLFYSWWDYRFLSLIIFSSLIDYTTGILIHRSNSQKRKNILLSISLFGNLSILFFFKYFNFFISSLSNVFSIYGIHLSTNGLNIILPIGISFYTFQSMSYTIDIYRQKIAPTNNLPIFLTYVSFFPQLVAGPIERASNLLPQFAKKRNFSYTQFTEGLQQILWGLFKKIVIADNAALIVNDIFANYSSYAGSSLIYGAILFSIQIYCDFSGYSDIAIGTARLFGFNLLQNFAFPYFSRNIIEFWHKWHISLTTWFRDYLYIPLGGSRVQKHKHIRNIAIVFIISGLWHGANITFLFWGAINALLYITIIITRKNKTTNMGLLPKPVQLINICLTFAFTTFAFIFFRSQSISDAFNFIKHIVIKTNAGLNYEIPTWYIATLILFTLVEWVNKNNKHGLDINEYKIPTIFKWSLYYILIVLIILNSSSPNEFIYFQF